MTAIELQELRLVFSDQTLTDSVFDLFSRYHSIGGFEFSPVRVEEFEDRYFDTELHALQLQRASLRVRCGTESRQRTLQWKRSVGDQTEDLRFEQSEWDAPPGDLAGGLALTGEQKSALENFLSDGGTSLRGVGLVKTTRRVVHVSRRKEIIALLNLDELNIQPADGTASIETAEIEVKGDDPRELVFLGESLANWFGLIKVRSSKLERHLPAGGPAERLLVDMDPGVDDALALLYLFARPHPPAVEGITIVGGNVSAMQCARNAARICYWAKRHGLINTIPPIGIGVDLSENRDDASNVHGSDGLGDLDWSEIDLEIDTSAFTGALELQERILRAYPGKVTVVATGPCSNLAQLVARCPGVLELAREVIVMGGAFFNSGNRGPRAEFNIHSDSAAAKRLLDYTRELVPDEGSSGHRTRVPLSFVGLDVTHRTILERKVLAEIDTPLGKLAAGISSKYMEFYRMVNGIDGCPLHDPLAIGLALNPRFLVREPYHVEVVSTLDSPETDGMTIADHRPCSLFKEHDKEVTQVCVSVNGRAFVEDFLRVMGDSCELQ